MISALLKILEMVTSIKYLRKNNTVKMSEKIAQNETFRSKTCN